MNDELPRAIGYWFHSYDEWSRRLPAPSTLVRPGWLALDQRDALVHYLRSAPEFTEYLGFSSCRFHCGISDEQMGAREYWDGYWVWPEGLAHYIEFHEVALPDEFVRHALTTPLPKSLQPTQSQGLLYDINYWIHWAQHFDANDHKGVRRFLAPRMNGESTISSQIPANLRNQPPDT